MQNPTLNLNSKRITPIYTNDYIRLNVGEKGLGAHVITNYDLTNTNIEFVAEGFDGNLINGGTVSVTKPASGEFNFIWPDMLTNMSSSSGHPFKGQFTLTGPNYTDVLSPFLIIVRPTLGLQEGYRSTINTIDTMIDQTLNDLGALHNLAEQAQNSAEGSLNDIKDYFNQQSNSLVSDVNQKINAINNLVAGMQTNVNSAINNTQNALQDALTKIKADGASTINQIKEDAQTTQKKQSAEFTNFLKNSESNLNAKLLNWQNALNDIKDKMNIVNANADTLKNRIDELNSNVGDGFADKKDLETLQKVVTSIQDSLKNFETSDTINNLKKELATKANQTELVNKANIADLLTAFSNKKRVKKINFKTDEKAPAVLASILFELQDGTNQAFLMSDNVKQVLQDNPSLLPKIPDLSVYAKKTDIPAAVNLSGYAKKTELNDYAKKTDIPALPDLSSYAKKTDIPVAVNLSGYATEKYVGTAVASKADKSEVNSISKTVQELASKEGNSQWIGTRQEFTSLASIDPKTVYIITAEYEVLL